MNLDFINRIIKTSLILALIVFPFLAVYVRVAFAVAYLLGCIWACLNLLAIRFVVILLINPHPKNKTLIALFIFLKFPLIYFLGYLLVIWSFTPIYGLLWGFSSLFLVTTLKVVSQSIFHINVKPRIKAR
ncbi:MAG: hypothetical protein DRP26_04130 [Candidatus Zixiibacteriota bacterium]|nr:MAG: hypothetical protein DRP26_04130 [candidate division Zixibacteria bacterium]